MGHRDHRKLDRTDLDRGDDASFCRGGGGRGECDRRGVAANTINFGAGGYALAGGTINLASADGNGGGTDVVVTGGNSIANNLVMTGGTSNVLGLSIGGAGTLSYSGVVTPYNGRMDLKDTVTLDLLAGSSISLTGSNGNQILFANTGSSLVLDGGSFSATGNNGANASVLYNLTMNSGTLSMGGALSSQVSLLAGGTVSLNGGTASVQGFSGAATNTMNFNGGTLRALASHASFLPAALVTKVQAGGAKVDTNGFNPVVGAVLAHDAALGATLDGGLVKSGTGTLILTAANTYTGGTTINAGTLQVGNGGATGSLGTGAVVDNAALVYNQTAITVGNAISGTGTVSGATAGTLTISQGIALTDNNFTFTSAGGSLAAGVGLSVGPARGASPPPARAAPSSPSRPAPTACPPVAAAAWASRGRSPPGRAVLPAWCCPAAP
ncbi:MAG: autotransporter-associated beta strand repeat-containing protein [Kiritimatiellia bacterium]